MKSLVLLLLTLALVLPAAGCGTEEGAVSAGPVPGEAGTAGTAGTAGETTSSESTSPGETTSEPAETAAGARRNYTVWFARGDELSPTTIEAPAPEGVALAAVELLLDGPPSGSGLATAIPAGTRLLGINLESDIATVDLSSEFESGGGSRSMFLRLAQVVYTMTEFDTVKSVRFHLDGEPVDVFSGEGIVLDKPVTRKDYEELDAPIVVESPTQRQSVSSPFTVSGSANVFEANVTLVLLDAKGKELVRTFTTATCGTGCRGDFSTQLRFKVSTAQMGTLLVQDDDADGDGRPSHSVEIPVKLVP
ncbi:MAG: GerMN domain-containing protein [Actinobacteria bacterium]|nr:GerMN domain-containing protein [Actinomycetota bacterium]